MLLIDTSAWVHHLRANGNPDIAQKVRALLQFGEASWCDVVRLELWNGARGEHESGGLKEMEQILPSLPITTDVWTRAIETIRRSRNAGHTIPIMDHLIKACAHVHKVELLHADKHFDLIK